MKFATKAIHVGEEPNLREGGSGDVVVPIHLSSTFARRRVEQPTGGYEYSRTGNPTRDALERRLAALEGARHGLAFASGLAAETTVLLSGDSELLKYLMRAPAISSAPEKKQAAKEMPAAQAGKK